MSEDPEPTVGSKLSRQICIQDLAHSQAFKRSLEEKGVLGMFGDMPDRFRIYCIRLAFWKRIMTGHNRKRDAYASLLMNG